MELQPFFHFDCHHFRGSKPCLYRRECLECPQYDPWSTRVLIIKLGAMGDVLRTTPLLPGLRTAYPGCHITWLTLPNIVALLENTGYIDRLLVYSWQNCVSLAAERFDLAVCLDKEQDIAAFMRSVRASAKYGFSIGDFGQIIPAGPSSGHLFHLGVSDLLKFRINKKTYPELIFDCLGIPYDGQGYVLPDLSVEIERAGARLAEWAMDAKSVKIGFNTGAGAVFATKRWTINGYITLGRKLVENLGARILLFGAEAERDRNEEIRKGIGPAAVSTGSNNSLQDFAGLIGQCDLVVTSDTLGMHLAIGLKRRVVALFGSTCHQEIDLFGRGVKVVTDFECSPCYLQTCPLKVTCMDDLSVDRVYEACLQALRI